MTVLFRTVNGTKPDIFVRLIRLETCGLAVSSLVALTPSDTTGRPVCLANSASFARTMAGTPQGKELSIRPKSSMAKRPPSWRC